jgi:hypothetical protein
MNNNDMDFNKWYERFDRVNSILSNGNSNSSSGSSSGINNTTTANTETTNMDIIDDNNDLTTFIKHTIDIETSSSSLPSWYNKSRSKLKDVYYIAGQNETRDSLSNITIPNILHDCSRYILSLSSLLSSLLLSLLS